MTVQSSAVEAGVARPPVARWGQLVFGIVCMVMIANLQYGWTLFVAPIDQKYHWGTTAIQVAFSVFIATETWLVPIEGWFVDRFGPRVVVALGGVFVAGAWSLNSFASSLWELYIAAALSGVGAGAVYGTCVGNALKWFPDLRGLAAGLTAAGFGAGTAALCPFYGVYRHWGRVGRVGRSSDLAG
jgi:OFA family oxalate/formate antiporter-like MFS transporter